ncbi:MAG TPA: T9SS type A sorting domain-containing protein [Bacteroidia bacterium]|nr:T9SS type A sorting domain-containing protein [Bacteroidia bacterium]
MKKLLLILAMIASTFLTKAQSIITVSGDITSNTTWTRNNQYVLSGFVYVTANAELIIESGTIIKGDKATKGSLIITRGSKIFALGNATEPVIFTSGEPLGTRTYGDWGGLIILGRAPINDPAGEKVIEGGIDAVKGLYGGTDVSDNSGTLEFVRIEFPGIAFQPNNEINGLTCGGVGNGTTINNIQVSYSGDDSYEFFGGTVNCKNLISYRGVDDDFDTDFGFSGNLQFIVALRDSNVADVSGSNGFESDNDATGSLNAPLTHATVSNATIIGPLVNAGTIINSNYKRGAHIRRSSQESLYNSIITGYPVGLFIDGTNCETSATAGDLEVKNTVLAGCLTNFAVASGSAWDLAGWYGTGLFANEIQLNVSDISLTDPHNYSSPNFLPQMSSSMLFGADFLSTRLTNSFFDAVTYRGAFGSIDWTSGWANWTPETNNYILSVNSINSISSFEVYPNPVSDVVNVKFNLNKNESISYVIKDLSGREVSLKNEMNLNAGLNSFSVNTSELSKGIYFLSISTHAGEKTVRLIK